MHNAILLSRMRAEGIDPILFSPEELELVAQAAEKGDFPLPSLPPFPIPRPVELSPAIEEIAHAAQACLDAVGPCSPIMQDAQRRAAATAATDLGRAFPRFREEIFRHLREDEARREALLSVVHTCRQHERQLICLHTAARIARRGEDASATAAALGRCEEELQTLAAALDALEGEMEGLSALCEARIPALLDTAAPLFDPAPEGPFSAADFRAAALALRDACTQLTNRKEEI